MRTKVRPLASLSGLRIPLRLCAVAVPEASSDSSDSTPSLGTSICHRCSPKKIKIMIIIYFLKWYRLFCYFLKFIYFFIFWPCLWHGKLPRPGIKQCPETQQWQCQILYLLSNQGIPLCLLRLLSMLTYLIIWMKLFTIVYYLLYI